MRTTLVINGEEGYLPKTGDPPKSSHTRVNVYTAMLLQIMRDYNNIDHKTIQAWEIRFFYDGLRSELRETTKRK